MLIYIEGLVLDKTGLGIFKTEDLALELPVLIVGFFMLQGAVMLC